MHHCKKYENILRITNLALGTLCCTEIGSSLGFGFSTGSDKTKTGSSWI